MRGREQEDVGTESYATESSVGINGMKPESADVSTSKPAGNVIARKRGRSGKDVLLDSKQKTGSQDDGRMLGAQDTIAEEQDEGSEGQGPLGDVLGAAPPGGLDTAPSGALATSPASSHSQPASQHPDLRMPSKTYTVHNSDNVTLGAMAGATKGGGGGGRVGTRVSRDECVHTKDGTCSIHGPGAKWRWRPIPPSQRTVGPDGKVKKRVYFWSCEVGVGGRNLTANVILERSLVPHQISSTPLFPLIRSL